MKIQKQFVAKFSLKIDSIPAGVEIITSGYVGKDKGGLLDEIGVTEIIVGGSLDSKV